jgi:hypothetical protein
MRYLEKLDNPILAFTLLAATPYYELIVLLCIPFPFNYVAGFVPAAPISYVLYRREKKKEEQRMKPESIIIYDMDKTLREYSELLKKQKDKHKK